MAAHAFAVVLLALAALFALLGLNPLLGGYFADYRDSPTGLYLTMTAIGWTLAGLFATAALLVLARRVRERGGFLVLAGLAVLASVLPYVLFAWTSERASAAWAFLVEDWIAWLLVPPLPAAVGVVVQVALAVLAIAALTGHVAQQHAGRAKHRRAA